MKLEIAVDGKINRENVPFQGLSMDWGFMCQKSNDVQQYNNLKTINVNTAYLLIGDHCTPFLDGICANGKSLPLLWLHSWLTKHKPKDTTDCYCRVDQGSELGRSVAFRKILAHYGYKLEPTGADAPW